MCVIGCRIGRKRTRALHIQISVPKIQLACVHFVSRYFRHLDLPNWNTVSCNRHALSLQFSTCRSLQVSELRCQSKSVVFNLRIGANSNRPLQKNLHTIQQTVVKSGYQNMVFRSCSHFGGFCRSKRFTLWKQIH